MCYTTIIVVLILLIVIMRILGFVRPCIPLAMIIFVIAGVMSYKNYSYVEQAKDLREDANVMDTFIERLDDNKIPYSIHGGDIKIGNCHFVFKIEK